MLDTETKRKIDACRDILVGKVPDPKSQVEQITIALIYKFMDDMDKQSEHWGGKPSFFIGEYERYGWSKMFDPRMGGHEMTILYGEAIERMNHNPNIPQLFRDIFKNAYLPYRDPETLKAFLKQINDFRYDHSEQLGDAYEYLLSVLSSQGDAGQFRTPRHIIDFIVQIVDPKKNETILDPACGTAGFLISSYRHILQSNKNKVNGDKLTPDDRKRIMNNFFGYDISPDMDRLSLVNLYLHDFPDPKIYEYDTLTSEERWDERADCIMANPPFMTPKGGIRPHKRFSVQAKRSEVLFVDYIAEHLNPHGRAGVIVPEGIIFQSQNAYKQLRKMLVDNFLWCVVSLPAGVFQPYSGVKTSILLMDRQLTKKTNKILFVKVESDGYDLGAQRREIDKNDLPKSLEYINQYKKNLLNGHISEDIDFALSVEKEKIAKIGDYNLSGDRYKTFEIHTHEQWPMVQLGDVFKLSSGKGLTSRNEIAGNYKVYGGNGIKGKHNEYFIEDSTLIIGRVGEYCGAIHLTEPKCWITDNALYVTEYLTEVNQIFIALILKQINIHQFAKVGGQPSISQTTVYNIKIPLPPLDVQEKIVAEIERYQKIIDGARQVVENYKPTIKINPDWPVVELGEVLVLQRGHDLPKKNFRAGNFPVVGSNGIIGYHDTYKYKGPGVVTGRSGTIGQVHYIEEDYWPHNTALFVKDFKGNLPKFILFLLQSISFNLKNLGERTSAVPSLDRKNAHRIKIQLPPLEVQQEIVTQIEIEQQAVNANKKLIEIFEQKVKDKIAEVWGDKNL